MLNLISCLCHARPQGTMKMIKIIQGDGIHGTVAWQCRSARMFSRAAAALIAAAAALLPSLDSGASIARLKFDPAAFAEGVSLAVEGMRIQSRAKARERHWAAREGHVAVHHVGARGHVERGYMRGMSPWSRNLETSKPRNPENRSWNLETTKLSSLQILKLYAGNKLQQSAREPLTITIKIE